jgi:hypothetical protein
MRVSPQQGEIAAMTGISSPYEPPTQPDLRLETGVDTLDSCVGQVVKLVNEDLSLGLGGCDELKASSKMESSKESLCQPQLKNF